MIINCYKQCEHANRWESEKSQRIQKTLIDWAAERGEPFIGLYSNIEYFNPGLGMPWNHETWHGEIDLLAVMRNHFIVIEMKSKKAIVRGRTQKGLWMLKYDNTNDFVEEKDYFTQCSEMKAFITQRYYCDYFKNIEQRHRDYKLQPDVLLVFKDGSDLSGIWITPPVRFRKEEYIKIIEKIDDCDKVFMDENFYWDSARNIYNRKVKQTDGMLKRLEVILKKAECENRVLKWFQIIEERELVRSLTSCGSKEFEFDEKDIKLIAWHFDMKETSL